MAAFARSWILVYCDGLVHISQMSRGGCGEPARYCAAATQQVRVVEVDPAMLPHLLSPLVEDEN